MEGRPGGGRFKISFCSPSSRDNVDMTSLDLCSTWRGAPIDSASTEREILLFVSDDQLSFWLQLKFRNLPLSSKNMLSLLSYHFLCRVSIENTCPESDKWKGIIHLMERMHFPSEAVDLEGEKRKR